MTATLITANYSHHYLLGVLWQICATPHHKNGRISELANQKTQNKQMV